MFPMNLWTVVAHRLSLILDNSDCSFDLSFWVIWTDVNMNGKLINYPFNSQFEYLVYFMLFRWVNVYNNDTRTRHVMHNIR